MEVSLLSPHKSRCGNNMSLLSICQSSHRPLSSADQAKATSLTPAHLMHHPLITGT
jgi:hypothetical protein